MRFFYEATDGKGERVYRGVLEAESPQRARRRLREMGLYPLRLERLRRPLRGRVPLPEQVLFMEEFATLVGAGVPVTQALHTLGLESRHPLLKEAARGVRERVEGGEGLSQAMDHYPEVFPPLVRALVAAAEVGGALEVVLRRIAEYLDRSHDLREKVRTALLYPSFVVGVLVLVVMVLLFFVIPVFARLYGAAAEELPSLYETLLRLAAAKELVLKRLEPGEAEGLGEVRAWRVELALEGPYPGVLAYLEALPKIPHPLWVEGYTLAPPGEAGGNAWP